MTREEIVANAQVILQRLNDYPNSLWFHYKAIKILGFQRCYELASLALQQHREGKVRTSPARYYNGCVVREIRERSSGGNGHDKF